jgi:hypothetical protein
MIHGEQDTYIKPDMGRSLAALANGGCEFWLVEGAKHNHALHVAGAEYHDRVLRFFERHLAAAEALSAADEDTPAPAQQESQLCVPALGG